MIPYLPIMKLTTFNKWENKVVGVNGIAPPQLSFI